MNFSPEFFTYMVGSTTDPAIGAQLLFVESLDVVKFDSDADFELKRLVCFADDGVDGPGGPQTESSRRIPSFNFNLRDNATGRTLFNGYVDTAELFGDGRIPFVLPTSHFFKRAGQAQMLYDPVNPGPDFNTLGVWLGLVGAKHFEKGLT